MPGIKGRTNKPIDSKKRDNILTIRLSDDELREAEEIAKELEIPRARLLRNLALVGLEDAKILRKTGILKGVKKFIDFKERLKNPEKFKDINLSNI